MPDVTAVIVNYRTPELTKGAARSCLSEPDVSEVIIIDNASGDESADILTNTFRGQRVRVMENDSNEGFASATNKGINRSRTEYAFVLNSDAFVLEGAIGILLERMRADAEIGVIGPEVLLDDAKTPQPGNYGPFPSARSIFLRDQTVENPLEPDWISGVAMMVNRRFMLEIDGFDNEYFMYFEDVDLCRRIWEHEKRVVREPKAKVIHFGGKSNVSSFRRKRMYYASQDRYLENARVSPLVRNMVKLSRWPFYFSRSVLGG